MAPVDPLSALLDADDRVVDVVLAAPWSIALGDRDEAMILAVSAGAVWCHRDEGEPVLLEAGDVALVRAGTARVLGHSAHYPGDELHASRRFRVEGAAPGGETHLFIRRLSTSDRAAADFVASLGREQVFTAARDSHVWQVLTEESRHLASGRSGVLARLIDLVFVEAVRRWAADGEARGWARAVLDPLVGAVLHLFHAEPDHPWTLEEIADRVGTTRTSISRRFEMFVGEPPMTYLREWRLSRAASMLTQGENVPAAARLSGFEDPFEFSAAFFKKYGVSPARYRTGGTADTA